MGFGQGVVNVGPQGVQGNLPQHHFFGAGDFRAGDAALDDDFDAFGAGLHGALGGLAHGAAVGDAALQLVGDVAGDQVGVEFGLFDFEDVELHPAAGDGLQLGAEVFDPLAIAPDQDSGAGGMDVDYAVLGAAVDFDPGDAGVGKGAVFVADAAAQGQIFLDQAAVGGAVGGVPVGFPVFDDAETEAVWMGFMAHS